MFPENKIYYLTLNLSTKAKHLILFQKFNCFWFLALLLLALSHPAISSFISWWLSYVGLFFLFSSLANRTRIQKQVALTVIHTAVYFFWLRWMTNSPYLAPLGIVGSFVIALVLASSIGMWGFFFHKCWQTEAKRWVLITASLSYCVLEYSRQYWFCGFPWYPLGLVWVESSLGMLSWLGPYWSGAPIIFAALKTAIAPQKLKAFFTSSLLLLALATATQISQSCLMPMQTVDAEAIIVHSERPISLVAPTLSSNQLHSAFTKLAYPFKGQHQWPLLIFPESIVSANYESEQIIPTALNFGTNLAKSAHAYTFLGIEDDFTNGGSIYNSLAIFNPDGKLHHLYAKRRLVPFSEYFPFLDWPLLSLWAQNIARLYGILEAISPGLKPGLSTLQSQDEKLSIALSICFEETFLDEIVALKKAGARLWISSSNDGWFPDPALALDHFYHARMLAAATGLPLLRSTQQGISCAINGKGNLLTQTQFDQTSNGFKLYHCSGPYENISTPFMSGIDQALWILWLILIFKGLQETLVQIPYSFSKFKNFRKG
jgi:apolipoprotein N-acyltransferase